MSLVSVSTDLISSGEMAHFPADQSEVMAQEERDSQMSPWTNIPVQWLEGVMKCLPIKQVFVCLNVCRAFNAASRFEISHRKELLICTKQSERKVRRVSDENIMVVAENMRRTLVSKMVLSLKQMVRLKKLFVLGLESARIRRWLRFDAPVELTMLEARIEPLIDSNHAEVFSQLQTLCCERVKASDVDLFMPQLKSLFVSELVITDDFDGFVNNKKICALYVEFRIPVPPRDSDLLPQVIVQMEKLKMLSLVFYPECGLFLGPFLTTLLHSLKNMSFFTFRGPISGINDLEENIEVFVNKNPGLRVFDLNHKLKTPAFHSLSRLPKLCNVSVCAKSSGSEGPLALMRGSSRKVLECMHFYLPETPDDQVFEAEVQSMRQETGFQYDLQVKSNFVKIQKI